MVKITEKNHNRVRARLLESAKVKRLAAQKCTDSILKTVQLIINTFSTGHKLLICGNGGSAADAQHMAAEFVCLLNKTISRPALPAVALTTNTSILTAYANDVGFDEVFKRQVQALGQAGDLLIGISTSGNSKNVIAAVEYAKSSGIHTIALIGDKGKLGQSADVTISVPSTNTQYIQETHIAIEHTICELVEEYLFL